MTRLAVIVTSTRQDRFADKPAAWVTDRLSKEAVDVDMIDMRNHDLGAFDGPAPLYTPRRYPSAKVAALGRRIDASDGFIVLTAEYNHGYTGVFKNALDHLYVEWDRKPMAFVGWGNVGGARAIEQLRTVAIELGVAPIRPAVHILPDALIPAMSATDYDPALFGTLQDKLDALVSELLWWTTTLRAARVEAATSAR